MKKKSQFSLSRVSSRETYVPERPMYKGTISSYIPKQQGITHKRPDCLPENKAIRGWMSLNSMLSL